MEMPSLESLPVCYARIEELEIAYRICGRGPALLLIHPWPMHGLTYAQLVDRLKDQFTCYVVDLPGAGLSNWSDKLDLTARGQADILVRLMAQFEVDRYSVYANDSGAMIARYMGMNYGEHIDYLIITNTEIPNHRGPWLPLYRKLLPLPGVAGIVRRLLRFGVYLRSRLAFGGSVYNADHLDDTFRLRFIEPLASSSSRMNNTIRFFTHCSANWTQVDEMADVHPNIKVPTLFIWAKDDLTFPVAGGRKIAQGFPNVVDFVEIEKARLYLHEERPDETAEVVKRYCAC